MSTETNDTRNAAFSILESAEFQVTQVGKGNRIVLRLDQRSRAPIHAVMKTGSLGQAMVKSKSGDPESEISGFGSDVSHVLFAMGDRRGDTMVFLVPKAEAEEAFRKAHRQHLVTHPDASSSTTWVIYFSDRGSAAANNYDQLWARYRVQPKEGHEPALSKSPLVGSGGSLTIAEAKRQLALTFGVPVESVKIVIEA